MILPVPRRRGAGNQYLRHHHRCRRHHSCCGPAAIVVSCDGSLITAVPVAAHGALAERLLVIVGVPDLSTLAGVRAGMISARGRGVGGSDRAASTVTLY
jgi:hypothetical protein